MSHLDLAEFRRFCKEKIIFTFNMVFTLFILLYVSFSKISNPIKQTSNTFRMYILVYYQFNTCSALNHHLLSLAQIQNRGAAKMSCSCSVFSSRWSFTNLFL